MAVDRQTLACTRAQPSVGGVRQALAVARGAAGSGIGSRSRPLRIDVDALMYAPTAAR